MTGSSTGDELRAAVSARRDLGPDFEDAIVESFLDKMGQEVDRRVDERLATSGPTAKQLARSKRTGDGQRLALAIVSLALGTFSTLALAMESKESWPIPLIWLAIVLVNVVFATSSRR
jgi:hypothetical protein